MRPGDSAYFLLRVTRLGPLVPAKIWLDDAEPGAPDNKLDRGNLSVYPRSEIAGEEVDPDIMQRDRLMSPTDWRPAYAPGHWKFAQTIGKGDYSYLVAMRAWAKGHRPADPTLQPREKIDPKQLPLPIFAEQES